MRLNFPYPLLVCDIGGTHARFALASAPGAPLQPTIHLETAGFAGLEAALEAVIPRLSAKPRSLIACAAGPVSGRKVTMTNAHWTIDGAAVAAASGLAQGLLLNDFEAQAICLPILEPAWVTTIGPPQPAGPGTLLVVGPGTGLGTAALVKSDGRFLPLSSEAGHIEFGPYGAEEAKLWPHIDLAPLGRVSVETLLSGPGLARLHRARLAAAGRLAPEMDGVALVNEAVADHGSEAAHTVRLFWQLLARFAGDMALVFMATGGVVFSGGILPRIIALLDAPKFRARFADKAPYGALLGSIGTCLIIQDDVVLSGMAALGATPEHYAIDYEQRAWR